MVLRFFLIASMFLLASCSVPERDSPYDPKGINYQGGGGGTTPSSSSVPPQTITHGPSVTYEGETYETVVTGTQTWMARNLNYNASGSLCYYKNESYCTTYGRLYNWATAMKLSSRCNSNTCASQVGAKHQGICPSGWHISSYAEWTTLANFVGSSIAGTKLKATSGWNNDNGTDDYGFAALPGGVGGSNDSDFMNVGRRGDWWSATEYDAYSAYSLSINDGYYIGGGDSHKDEYFRSVRCVMD